MLFRKRPMAETDEQLNDTNEVEPTNTDEAVEDIDPIESLQSEVEDLKDKHLRALAEIQNTQRRSRQNEEEARKQGARRILDSVVPVLDHFDLALGLDPATTSAEQIMGGVSAIREEFRKALAAAGVTEIAVEPGAEFDPQRCEAMLRQPSDEVAEGCVIAVLQGGYAMGDRVIRPAKVSVSSGPAESAGGEEA
ncbi:MAG: nucleotide exchange factor GrpE [Planctomycetota bacterium]